MMMVKPSTSRVNLVTARTQLRKTAVKQAELIDYSVNHPEPISQIELERKINVSSSILKTGEANRWLTRKAVEVYRDPFQTAVVKTQPLHLNPDQTKAVSAICALLQSRKTRNFSVRRCNGER